MSQPNPQPAQKSDNTFWVYLAYLLWWVLALIGLATVKDDDRVRFHCAQALAISAAVTAVIIVLAILAMILSGIFFAVAAFGAALFISGLFAALNWLLVLAYYALAIYIVVLFSQGKDFRAPFFADFAEKNLMKLFK